MSKINEDLQQKVQQEQQVQFINTKKWRKGLVVEDKHDKILNNNNNDDQNIGKNDNSNNNDNQNKTNIITNIDDNYQKLINEIHDIQIKLEIINKQYHEKREFLQGAVGESSFLVLCPDIDVNPEKYLDKQGQIQTLAKLGVENKLLQDQLNIKIKKLELLQKLIQQLSASPKELIKEILYIQNLNDQLFDQKKQLKVEIDTYLNEFEEIKLKLKVVDVINELKKRIQNHTDGI